MSNILLAEPLDMESASTRVLFYSGFRIQGIELSKSAGPMTEELGQARGGRFVVRLWDSFEVWAFGDEIVDQFGDAARDFS